MHKFRLAPLCHISVTFFMSIPNIWFASFAFRLVENSFTMFLLVIFSNKHSYIYVQTNIYKHAHSFQETISVNHGGMHPQCACTWDKKAKTNNLLFSIKKWFAFFSITARNDSFLTITPFSKPPAIIIISENKQKVSFFEAPIIICSTWVAMLGYKLQIIWVVIVDSKQVLLVSQSVM